MIKRPSELINLKDISRYAIDPSMYKRIVEDNYTPDKKCIDCNIYDEERGPCKETIPKRETECPKDVIHRKTGFMSGGGKKDKLIIVM